MLDSPELQSLGQHHKARKKHLGINSFLTLGKEKRKFRDSALERTVASTVIPKRKRNFNYGAKELLLHYLHLKTKFVKNL